MFRRVILAALLFGTVGVLADTPPVINIFKLKGGGLTGAVTVESGVVTNVSPGAVGNVLKSDGTKWVSDTGGGGGTWGSIGGTLSDQTDLQTALNGKEPTITTLPINKGGTGQTTAATALNALLPVQTGNTGKALFTDGTNAAWQTAAGTGTVTSVSASAPLSVTNPTTTPAISITQAGAASDGFLSSVDWNTFNNKQNAISGTANRFAGFNGSGALEAIPSYARNAFGGATITQTLTPANTGSNPVLSQRDVSITPTTPLTTDYIYGDLETVQLNGTNNFLSYTGHEWSLQQTGANNITDGVVMLFPRINYGVGGGVNSSQNTRVIDSQIRLQGNHTANQITGVNSDVLMDGGTTATTATAARASTYVGGTVVDATGIISAVQVDGTATGSTTGILSSTNSVFGGSALENLVGINSNHNGPVQNDYVGLSQTIGGNVGGNSQDLVLSHDGDISGGSTNVNIYQAGQVTGNTTGIGISRNGATLGAAQMLFANVNASSPVTGNLDFLSFGGSGTVGGFMQGVNIYQNAAITKGVTGLNMNVDADVGDGTGTNAFAVNAAFTNNAVDGGIWGFNLYNSSTVSQGFTGVSINNDGDVAANGLVGFRLFNTGDIVGSNLSGVDITNSGPGESLFAFSVQNTAAMAEGFRGLGINQNAATRTATGVDINMSGNATDDVQGIRVNMTGQTSTNQHPSALQTQGGTATIYSDFFPFPAINPVEIGNNFTATARVASGAPLTAADQFIQFMQSNLVALDDIALGPFGLGVNMVGAVSQIEVGSGKTVPIARSLLLGTSVPAGSGGTLTDHVVLELLGLPSFGGAVTNPARTGIQDSQLLGQNFCDGATDCAFLRVRDANAKVELAGPVNSNKGLRLSTSGTQPTCDATTRGLMWNVEGGPGVADLFQVCQKDAADVYGWVTK